MEFYIQKLSKTNTLKNIHYKINRTKKTQIKSTAIINSREIDILKSNKQITEEN